MSNIKTKHILVIEQLEEKKLNEIREFSSKLNFDHFHSEFENLKVQNNSVKQMLKEYQDQYENEKNILARLNAEAVTDDETDMNYEKEKNQQSQEELDLELEELKSKLQERKNYLKELREKAVHEDKDFEELVIPSLRKEYEVYRNLFPITYDLDCPDNIQGNIFSSSKSNTKNFKFNTETNSKQAISHYMWTLLADGKNFME